MDFFEKISSCNIEMVHDKIKSITIIGQPMTKSNTQENISYRIVEKEVNGSLVQERIPVTISNPLNEAVFELAKLTDETIKQYVGIDIALKEILAIVANDIMKQNNFSSASDLLASGMVTINTETTKINEEDDHTEEYLRSRARVILNSIYFNETNGRYEISAESPDSTYLIKYQLINMFEIEDDADINKIPTI